MVLPTIADSRAMLRAAMRHWPHASEETMAFVGSLPWAARQVVVWHYGEGRPLEWIASELNVAERTVQRYLHLAHRLYPLHTR